MVDVVERYIADQRSMGIVPVAHEDYQSIVLTIFGKLYVNMTPYEIIKQSCLEWGASYEGRKESLIYHFGHMKKFAIPIHPESQIIAFPTHSPNAFSCCWVFPNHVASYKEYIEKVDDCVEKCVLVTYYTGEQLVLRMSLPMFKRQFERSYLFLKLFTEKDKHFSFVNEKRGYYTQPFIK